MSANVDGWSATLRWAKFGLPIILLIAAGAVPARGQLVVQCQAPANCVANLPSGASSQPLSVRVTDATANPLQGVLVRWSLRTAAAVATQFHVLATRTDANGVARYRWTGRSGSASVYVVATAATGPDAAAVEFTLRRQPPLGGGTLKIRGGDQIWRPGQLLRDPIDVQFRIPTAGDCSRHRVVFEPRASGTAFPDTAIASERSSDPMGRLCAASAHWILGSHVGHHELEVAVPTARLRGVAESFARRSGRVSAALAVTVGFGLSSFDTKRARADTAVIAVTTSEGGVQTVRTMREVASRDTLQKQTLGTAELDPLVGIDFPIDKRFRVYVAASAEDPSKVFFVGLEILQLIHPGTEATGVGFYVGGRGQRRTEATFVPTDDGGSVKTENAFRIQGPAFAVSIDAGSLLSSLLKAAGAT